MKILYVRICDFCVLGFSFERTKWNIYEVKEV
jgi:hypothetical protein